MMGADECAVMPKEAEFNSIEMRMESVRHTIIRLSRNIEKCVDAMIGSDKGVLPMSEGAPQVENAAVSHKMENTLDDLYSHMRIIDIQIDRLHNSLPERVKDFEYEK